MGRTRKVLLTLLIVATAASLAGVGVFSAFSSTTSNPSNSFAAGSVAVGDNDAGATMFNVSNAKPGDAVSKCIKVTYTGTLDSTVKLYTASTIGTLGPYINVTITPGTQGGAATFPDCTSGDGFVADAGSAIYTGTLASIASTHNNFANGLADNPGATATKWVANDNVVYRVTYTLQDNNSAAGLTTGSHAFTWEAQNQ